MLTRRRLVLVIAVPLATALLLASVGNWREVQWGTVGTYDFVQYWGAAKLMYEGGDPYDPAAMLALQQRVGSRYAGPIQSWNPPWTLALMLPLAVLPFGYATLTWTAIQTLALFSSGLLLWRYFAGAEARPWWGLLLVAGFFPCFSATNMGQISYWLLLGVVGFLWGQRKGWDVGAGVALALLMIKPHVTYLFWMAALWWVWRHRRWRILIGWFGTLIAASGLIVLVFPDAFMSYLAAFRNPPLRFESTTFGTWLRVLLGWEFSWLQFVPSLVGGLGLLAWLWRWKGNWRWEVLTGPLLLVSMITAAYGWSHDQVVLLPAVVAMVVGLSARDLVERLAILVLFVGAQLGLAAMYQSGLADAYNVWHAPLLGGLYWWSRVSDRSDSG